MKRIVIFLVALAFAGTAYASVIVNGGAVVPLGSFTAGDCLAVGSGVSTAYLPMADGGPCSGGSGLTIGATTIAGGTNGSLLYVSGGILQAEAASSLSIGWSQITGTPTTAAGYGMSTTGSGSVVQSISPTLVTPALGTPSTLVLTSATGLPAASLTGTTLPSSIVSSSLASAAGGSFGTAAYDATGATSGTIPVLSTGGVLANAQMQGNIGIEIDFFYSGMPGASAMLAKTFSRQTVVAASAPIKCSALTGAMASTTATLYHVVSGTATAVGALVFAASGSAYQTCTATFASAVTFAPGDTLIEVFPASPDATLAGIAVSIAALQ